MKKAALFLVIILSLSAMLFAADGLYIKSGEAELYNPWGMSVEAGGSISDSGYVVRSNQDTTLDSPFGQIDLTGGSLLAVTGFSTSEPSIYLVDGQMSVRLTTLSRLTVYTSSASYYLTGSGEYHFLYTADSDIAINNSAFPVSVYDALRREESVIQPYHYSDLIAHDLDIPLVAQHDVIQEGEHYTISGTYSFRGLNMSYSLSSAGYGHVSYPAGYVTQNDLAYFFSQYAKHCPFPVEGVTYTLDSDGELSLTYPDIYTQEEISSVAEDFLIYLDNYLASVFTPASPLFSSVKAEVERVPAAPAAPVSDTVSTIEEETGTPAEDAEVPPAPFLVAPWTLVED